MSRRKVSACSGPKSASLPRRARFITARRRVVALLSHVQRELAAQAQAAGCSEVLPRSAFTQNLASILEAARD